MTSVLNALTFDVEDWFHILDLETAPTMNEWSELEPRVEHNVDRILDLLDDVRVRSTCFILGWVAKRHPGLVRRLSTANHEIASHGYAHELVYEIGPDRFRADVEESIEITAETIGVRPVGYRAPGFSITRDSTWALDILAELGMRWDSSLFPTTRGHGGFPGIHPLPSRLQLPQGRSLIEFPISVAGAFGRRIPYSGGGYLRLLPYAFIRSRVAAANQRGEPVVVYLHPRDIDPEQPRIPMPLVRRFKSYVNLHTTWQKLRLLLAEFRFGTLTEALDSFERAGGTYRQLRIDIGQSQA